MAQKIANSADAIKALVKETCRMRFEEKVTEKSLWEALDTEAQQLGISASQHIGARVRQAAGAARAYWSLDDAVFISAGLATPQAQNVVAYNLAAFGDFKNAHNDPTMDIQNYTGGAFTQTPADISSRHRLIFLWWEGGVPLGALDPIYRSKLESSFQLAKRNIRLWTDTRSEGRIEPVFDLVLTNEEGGLGAEVSYSHLYTFAIGLHLMIIGTRSGENFFVQNGATALFYHGENTNVTKISSLFSGREIEDSAEEFAQQKVTLEAVADDVNQLLNGMSTDELRTTVEQALLAIAKERDVAQAQKDQPRFDMWSAAHNEVERRLKDSEDGNREVLKAGR